MRLPIGYRSSQPCEIRVGRYCYWRGDEGDDKPAPPEQPAVRQRRAALAANARQRIKRVAGRRVDYRPGRALSRGGRQHRRRADHCARELPRRRELVPCARGYASHIGGRFAAADSEFSLSLAAMEPADRCRWLDISDLIGDDFAKRFASLDCSGREGLARRALRIGAPLYSVSNSDLFTEHLARMTRARIAEHSAGPDGESFADDIRELMVRYGWPRWYSRTEPPLGSQASASITGHDAGMPYNFLPSLGVIDRASQAGRDDWHLDDARALTGYSPSYARTMHDLPSQVARFRRGDSTLIVAAWTRGAIRHSSGERSMRRWSSGRMTRRARSCSGQRPRDRDDRCGGGRGFGTDESGASGQGGSTRGENPNGLLATRFESRRAVGPVALHADRDVGRRARTRPGQRFHERHHSAVAGAGCLLGNVGLQPAGEPVRFTLTVEQIGVGWLRRAAERLRVADRTTGLRIQWQEVPQRTNDIAGRGVRVDVSRLRAGRYRMQLTVNAAGDASAVATREIDVR